MVLVRDLLRVFFSFPFSGEERDSEEGFLASASSVYLAL
jgi:hypothetical protein